MRIWTPSSREKGEKKLRSGERGRKDVHIIPHSLTLSTHNHVHPSFVVTGVGGTAVVVVGVTVVAVIVVRDVVSEGMHWP